MPGCEKRPSFTGAPTPGSVSEGEDLKTKTRVVIALAVAFVIPTATLTVVLKHERDRSTALAWRQADLCLRTARMLQIIVEHPPPYALQNWSQHFFLGGHPKPASEGHLKTGQS